MSDSVILFHLPW